MTGADVLNFTGDELPLPPQTPPTYDVAVGWNLIGFKGTAPMAAGDYLAAIAGKWTKIWGYSNGLFVNVAASDMLMPGQGYWLAVTQTGTIYP